MKIKGYLYWIFTCTLGSIVQASLFASWVNNDGVFNFKISDTIFLIAVLFLLSMSVSLPLILVFKWLLKINKLTNTSQFFYQNLVLIIFFTIVYLVPLVFQLLNNNEASKLIFPYGIIGLLTLNLYLINYLKRRTNMR